MSNSNTPQHCPYEPTTNPAYREVLTSSSSTKTYTRRHQEAVLCYTCGQFHGAQQTHLYDYSQTVDDDLLCLICLQPLVDPLDTRCGHTFCDRCIGNYLKIQRICPIDRQPLTEHDCQHASIMVRRLLDKLLVVCPNVDYCEEVLPRSDLEAHLQHRCRGAVIECVKSHLGCTFQGPRSALQSHLWECPFKDEKTVLPKMPVMEGEVTTIEIPRGCYDFGMAIVGGVDTPLMCVLIQEIFPEGVAAKDGRLRPGDQLLEVNGVDLTQASHEDAKRSLSQMYPICRLTVYREKAEENHPIEKEEILRIGLTKVPGRQLGIKLVGKKNGPGVYILSLIPGGLASSDGRLIKDDRILEINGQDVTYGTQELAAQIIQSSPDKVQFVVSRKTRPQTPDLIRSTSTDCITDSIALERSCIYDTARPRVCKERTVQINKEPSESLGISVAGGVGSARGDVPIYITNIQPQGCVGRCKQIKKGDILLSVNGLNLVGLTHTEAVRALKSGADAKSVILKIIEGPETNDGISNFTPSWTYWLMLPKPCQLVKTIALTRNVAGSLGFSIVGGNDMCYGTQAIHVKTIVPGTPACLDGRLRCGDIILSVNNYSLGDIAHTHAVSLLKHIKGTVALNVVSWPGTLV
ncbi:ligand of Numb protein X 2-like isoform X1 [Tubulanus polymorphus]|uniref:ligand of Numb protein X 2-like isoform X1 n=1 Tax=Tubulanus polymorphus TaxID=672921 RepID=UPI003DA33023